MSGALGMSIVGAFGIFSSSIFQPIIEGWIDSAHADVAVGGLVGNAAELAAGQDVLQTMISFPTILIILFTILVIWMRKRNATQTA